MEALGKRLVKRSSPASDDLKSLQELLLAFDEPLAIAVDLVRDQLGYEPTSRIKTTGTILDKLHRQGGSILKAMQDLAGMRIVSDCNRHEQDRIANKLMRLFAEFGPPLPKLVDRRTHPSHGYRAVHIIVYVDGAPVEIQVRTKLQHEWADLFEKLADRVGRGIRYGEPPEHWRDGVVDLASDAPDMSPSKRYALERLYTAAYDHREITVRFARALAYAIDVYERDAPTAAPDDLADLTAGITAGFASIRSSIIEFAPRARPTRP